MTLPLAKRPQTVTAQCRAFIANPAGDRLQFDSLPQEWSSGGQWAVVMVASYVFTALPINGTGAGYGSWSTMRFTETADDATANVANVPASLGDMLWGSRAFVQLQVTPTESATATVTAAVVMNDASASNAVPIAQLVCTSGLYGAADATRTVQGFLEPPIYNTDAPVYLCVRSNGAAQVCEVKLTFFAFQPE